MATFDCMSKTASLHWSDSAGAQTYVVRAEAPFGHPVALSTNDTSAQLSELTCGQNYSLTVSALNSRCRGESTSEPTSLQTGVFLKNYFRKVGGNTTNKKKTCK